MNREILELIPKFLEKFTHAPVMRWHTQAGKFSQGEFSDINYYPEKTPRALEEKDLVLHFSQIPRHGGGLTKGAIAIGGKFSNGRVQWVCIDADEPHEYKAIFDKVIPYLEKENIDYVLEYSQKERCHLWIMMDVPWDYANQFAKTMMVNAGCGKEELCDFDEVYPTEAGRARRVTNIIRIPGGYHMKTKKANPIEYKGTVSSDPVFIMQTFINARRLTEADILSYVPVEIKKKSETKKTEFIKDGFLYTSLELDPPDPKMPHALTKMCATCPAMNKVFKQVIEERGIDKRSGLAHDTGLYVTGMCKYASEVSGTADGEVFYEWLIENYRTRDPKSHNWTYYKEKPGIVPTCETFDKTYHACEGCPLKGREGFYSPRQILRGEPIVKTKIKEAVFVTPEQVRNTTFKDARNIVINAATKGLEPGIDCEVDLRIISPQGSGKSVALDQIAAELAGLGQNVLIAVPTAELAFEHKERLEALGVKPFLLMSFDKIFDKSNPEKFDLDFFCPNFDDIKAARGFGVAASHYKKKYCKECPFREKCPFPDQWKNVMDPKHKVVIMQHAHFKIPKMLELKLLPKGFRALFVDENFIRDTLYQLKPTEVEIEILLASDRPWAETLGKWMRDGGYPRVQLCPNESQLETVWKMFEDKGIDWRIPDFLRAYTDQRYMSLINGVKVFYEIPQFPIRVFTDATSSEKMLKLVLDNKNLLTLGAGQVVNPKYFHPDNEVYQMIDGSMSKNSMKDGRFEKIMEFIIAEIDEKYPTEKILVTVFQDEEMDVKAIFQKLAPELLASGRVIVSHMKVGVNEWHDCHVQFLVAGVYPTGRDIYQGSYEYKSIANYWKKKRGEKLINNPYPVGPASKVSAGYLKYKQPIAKIELDGVYEYPQIEEYIATLDFNKLVQDDFIAKTQQAIRIRYKKGERRFVYIFGNISLPSFPVTSVRIEGEFVRS